jgi:hypothetical protein
MADKRLLELMKVVWDTPFPPGCRGVNIEGVELILADADVYGVATWYDDNDEPLSDQHVAMLTKMIDELDRIKTKLPNEEAEAYYQLVRELAAYLLESRGPKRPARADS